MRRPEDPTSHWATYRQPAPGAPGPPDPEPVFVRRHDPDVIAAVRRMDTGQRRDLWEFFDGARSAARRDDATEILAGYYSTASQLPAGAERDAIQAEIRRLIVSPPPQRRPLT